MVRLLVLLAFVFLGAQAFYINKDPAASTPEGRNEAMTEEVAGNLDGDVGVVDRENEMIQRQYSCFPWIFNPG